MRSVSRRAALAIWGQGAAALALSGCAAQQEVAPETNPEAAEATDEQKAEVGSGLPHPLVLASLSDVDADEVTTAADWSELDYSLDAVTNRDDWYFDESWYDLLRENLFFIAPGGSDEFYQIYETNRYDLDPSFVTVDSLMHTYHLYFSHLLKTTERTSLAAAVDRLGQLMLAASLEQAEQAKGTAWEDAAWRNVALFAVPASLAGHWALVPEQVGELVDRETQLVEEAAGIATCDVTGVELDYSQFAPRGYYEGDEALERYFRVMMWYGQLSYLQRDEDLDRSAALLTCALEGEALELWEALYAVTAFFAGASDDNGYYEYKPLLDEAFGKDATTADLLASADGFARFHELTETAKAPQINSIPTDDEGTDADKLDSARSFRLMGQRFSLDAAIMQRLVYNQVGENPDGAKRMLPDALDVPAALGSDEALAILEGRGATAFEGYADHMQTMRAGMAEAPADLWRASLYSQWLHTLQPLLNEESDAAPPFMRSQAWLRKDLLSYLGSYAELKHDTVLYAKQVMAEMGGGPEEERDDRGYVEPEPVVFGRLAALTQATAEGLAGYGMLGDEDATNLARLSDLADQLATIATKELAGELPTDDEFELIRSYGGQLEHFWQEVYKDEADDEYFTSREFPAAVVTDIATDPNGSCLELATGRVADLYVIVPIDGQLRIARGGVFSFYQFPWPLNDRLTDSAWRQMLDDSWSSSGEVGSGNGIFPEDWTEGFQAHHTGY